MGMPGSDLETRMICTVRTVATLRAAVSRSGTIYVLGGDGASRTVQRLFVPRKFTRR